MVCKESRDLAIVNICISRRAYSRVGRRFYTADFIISRELIDINKQVGRDGDLPDAWTLASVSSRHKVIKMVAVLKMTAASIPSPVGPSGSRVRQRMTQRSPPASRVRQPMTQRSPPASRMNPRLRKTPCDMRSRLFLLHGLYPMQPDILLSVPYRDVRCGQPQGAIALGTM